MHYQLYSIFSILILFFLFFPLKTSAESESSRLDPIVVTGTNIPSDLISFPSDVTVIDSKIIRDSQADNISELLKTVPGVFVDQQGARGGISSVYIRGADPNFTLVLLDGVKLNDPNNSRGGSFDLSTISTDNVRKIEIIKGPQSFVYGSDAIAGVINIITYKGLTETKRVVDISGEADKGYRVLTEVRGSGDNFYYSFSGSYLDDGDPVEGSGFKSPSIIANLGYYSDKFEINSVTRYAYIDSESFPDDSGGPEFAVIRESERRKTNQLTNGINAYYEIRPFWSNNLKLNFTLIQEDTDSPGVAPGIRDPFGIAANESDNRYYRLEAEYINSVRFLETNAFSVGLDLQYENGESNGQILLDNGIPTGFELERYTVSPLAEVKLNPYSNLYVTLGGRIDIPEDFDTEFSPFAGIKFIVEGTGTVLSADWGEGFKLPSFFALGNPVVGNSGLRPETSRSYEFKIEQTFSDLFVGSITYFDNEFKNLIDLEEGPPPLLVNRSRVTTRGFEAALQTKEFYNAVITGNLSYVDSDIKGTDEELRNRPNWLANIVILWSPVNTLDFYMNINYVGEYLDSSIPTGDRTIGNYVVVNTAVTFIFKNGFESYIAVENLFNKDYQQFVGFDAPGIRPRIGLRWTF